jgi:hypothetical protein
MADDTMTTHIWETLELLQVRLDKVGGARPDRRPRMGELDSLEVKQVRTLVQVGQESVMLELGSKRKQVRLTLDWLQRWGGTFGPKSSAEANSNRGRDSVARVLERLDEEPSPDRKADRGQVPAWLLYFSCPKCDRRCRKLYSLRAQHDYACPKCVKPCDATRDGGPSGVGGPAAKRERAVISHRHHAARIRRDYLSHDGPLPGILASSARRIPKPPRMTWNRYEALVRLVEAHETIAMGLQIGAMFSSLNRITGTEIHPTLQERVDEQDMFRWANNILRLDAWALRQKSWHRRGKPRDTPGQGTREKDARLETSTDSQGHAETNPS